MIINAGLPAALTCRRAMRLGRLSHWVLLSVFLCIFVRFSELPILTKKVQTDKTVLTESHWKRTLSIGIEKNKSTPAMEGRLAPDEEESRAPDEGKSRISVEAVDEIPNLNWTHIMQDERKSSPSFPYRYLINEEDACNEEIHIINIVPIKPSSVYTRNMIRQLWGKSEHRNITHMKTMFLVGLPSSSEIQHILEQESADFHDILQVEFIDSYQNLTLKTLTILHWTENFCPSATWILKSDDDVFVNSFTLKNFLGQTFKKNFQGNAFVCKMNGILKVCRSEKDCQAKWVIPKSLYASENYPPYCNGPAYVMSSPMARRIFNLADKTHPFPMEDVYYTGILARALNPRYINLRTKFREFRSLRRSFYGDHMPLFISHVEKKKGNSLTIWYRILKYYNLL